MSPLFPNVQSTLDLNGPELSLLLNHNPRVLHPQRHIQELQLNLFGNI